MAEYTKDEPFEFEGLLVWRDRRAIKWRLRGSRNGHDSQVSPVTADTLHAFIEAERDEWRWTNDEHTEARRGRWRVEAAGEYALAWHDDLPAEALARRAGPLGESLHPDAARVLSDFLAWKSAQEQPAEPTGLGAVVEVDGMKFVHVEDPNAEGKCWIGPYDYNDWTHITARGPVTILSPGVDA